MTAWQLNIHPFGWPYGFGTKDAPEWANFLVKAADAEVYYWAEARRPQTRSTWVTGSTNKKFGSINLSPSSSWEIIAERKEIPTVKSVQNPPKLDSNQSRMINQLLLKGALRSDELATAIGVTPDVAAYALLPLRNAGFLSSTNDGQRYNLWSTTSTTLLLGQEQPKHFGIFIGESVTLHKTLFATLEEAQNKAAEYAVNNKGTTYTVVQMVYRAKQEKDAVTTVTAPGAFKGERL